MVNPLADTPRYAVTALVFLGVYFVTLSIGRLLKRRGGVRFDHASGGSVRTLTELLEAEAFG